MLDQFSYKTHCSAYVRGVIVIGLTRRLSQRWVRTAQVFCMGRVASVSRKYQNADISTPIQLCAELPEPEIKPLAALAVCLRAEGGFKLAGNSDHGDYVAPLPSAPQSLLVIAVSS